MSADREQQFLDLVKEFPDSPMGHFSLGKHYLESRRWEESARALGEAVRLDPQYAAAWVALGDALAGARRLDEAREAFRKAGETAHGQRDASFREELEERLRDL
jgi:Flp pilus assembly protein TadD